MKTIKIKQQEIETSNEPKLDLSLLKKKTSAKTPAGLILSYAKKFKKDENMEMVILFQEIYRKMLLMQKTEKINFESWRGRGAIKVWKKPDRIIVEFAGPRDKGEKPNIQKKQYFLEEINKMIDCINKLKDKYENKIPSRKLGEEYFGGNWDSNVFSKRKVHTKFTHLLNILDYYKIIKYNRAGITSVLNDCKGIQEVLK